MEVRKHYCDLCKKEIYPNTQNYFFPLNDKEKTTFILSKVKNGNAHSEAKKTEICRECLKKIEKLTISLYKENTNEERFRGWYNG